jgi:hypothetical protein
MRTSRRNAAFFVLLFAALACSLPGAASPDPALEGTRVALGVQQTGVAIQQATQNAPAQPPPAETYTPYPTYTQPAASVTETPADVRARIQASNILIYEDIVGNPTLVPIVGNTVNAMGFSGGKVVNVGDALGDFLSQANSATAWDLMIVSAESRDSFSGEMFEAMYDHINNGGAAIIEVWYLDQVASGKIAPILSKCGVGFYRDWIRNANYDPFSYSVYWLDTSHPLLSTPNIVEPPAYPYPIWFTDAGDLLELSSGGDAALVGGLYANRKSDHGVLASCLGGRMVIQTFSTHDYKMDVIQPLWENYITYTLTKRYEYTP